MAKKQYSEKLRNINLWVEIVNHHWERLNGELFNDVEFWDDTLHAMTADDWWDWVDIEPSLKIQYNDEYLRYPKLESSTEEVKKMLMLGKDVVKKNRKGKNFQGFRALMNIKDFLNDINGTPTTNASVKDPDEPKNTFHIHFHF